MTIDPQQLLYLESHEWVGITGDTATVGITRFAVDQLNDITYVELPSIGTKLNAKERFGTVESVKSTSELYSPVTGEVVEVNANLAESPELLNTDPYQQGWLLRLRIASDLDTSHLKDKAAYDQQCAAENSH